MSFEASPPDPTNPDLLVGLRTYLMEKKIVREPKDATDQKTLPPMWLAPRHGTPAPGPVEGLASAEISPNPSEGGPGLVVGADRLPGPASGPYEGFIRYAHIQFVVRGYNDAIPAKFEQEIRAALNDKRGWTMFNVPVNESLLFRDMQLLERDNTAYTYMFEYSFSLWGPFTPVGP